MTIQSLEPYVDTRSKLLRKSGQRICAQKLDYAGGLHYSRIEELSRRSRHPTLIEPIAAVASTAAREGSVELNKAYGSTMDTTAAAKTFLARD
jgi:hypothetical protein